MTKPIRVAAARRLRQGQFLRLDRRQRWCLRAERGSLWVTVDGEIDDIELDAPASRVFEGGAVVLVGTLGPGDAAFSAVPLPAAPPWHLRLLAWLKAPRPRRTAVA